MSLYGCATPFMIGQSLIVLGNLKLVENFTGPSQLRIDIANLLVTPALKTFDSCSKFSGQCVKDALRQGHKVQVASITSGNLSILLVFCFLTKQISKLCMLLHKILLIVKSANYFFNQIKIKSNIKFIICKLNSPKINYFRYLQHRRFNIRFN